ncbi:hypothetical protein sr13833 [Sporisorium reilianum SRZ2]|uniref:DUF7888 domain-containing protein n=1 Tax=Sporisorium reilianum (strain SRZ2) TaxID=999809 RepID=E7A116_SPORE|nr:hypothetical protein sr13833 [Sporisorium reilianum SRZ2]
MRITGLSLATVILATSALASHVSSSHRLERRHDRRPDCTKDMANFWSGYKTPPGWTATVCYRTDFQFVLGNNSTEHYQFAAKDWCWQRHIEEFVPYSYTCHHLIGANTFEIKAEGGSLNLAVVHNKDKCDWNGKVLGCKA